jgi:hypothetical protein
VSPTDSTLFAKANCVVPAIDGPMLNRSLLTPIYPASLSDCLFKLTHYPPPMHRETKKAPGTGSGASKEN